MTATTREIAEKLCKEAIGTNSFVAEKIAAVLDAYGKEREREGYERGIRDAAELSDIRYCLWSSGMPVSMNSIANEIRALAQKDVKL